MSRLIRGENTRESKIHKKDAQAKAEQKVKLKSYSIKSMKVTWRNSGVYSKEKGEDGKERKAEQ